jgi:uncharacterized protein
MDSRHLQHDAIGTDPVMLDMLRWHGAEEVEHKAVAFDTMKHRVPGIGGRCAPSC